MQQALKINLPFTSLLPFLQLISGQYVFPHHDGSPQVEVEILGIPVDLSKIRSLPVSKNSVNPIWNEAYTFQVLSHQCDIIFVVPSK